LKTTFEKALWLLQFKASRKKLASSKFDGVSVNRKGSTLEVCVRDRDDDEQLQAATELLTALKHVEAKLNVSDSFSLPGAVINKLGGDPDLKRLEREQRVLVIRPKKGTDAAATDAPAVLRLVSDGSSDVICVQAYLSETYTSVEREVDLPKKVAHLSYKWLEQQILQPAEARHKVKISLVRDSGSKGGSGSDKTLVKSRDKSFRICGVPGRVVDAIAAVEAAMQATQVKFLDKQSPEPELVDVVRKLRKDLLSNGDEEEDGVSTDSNNKDVGKLLVSVFAPSTPGAPPPFVKVTLAMAPSAGGGKQDYTALEEAHKSMNALLDSFGKTSFLISAQFPKQIDAHAATDALEEKLRGQGKTDFARSCGLVKVEWNNYDGKVILVGNRKARDLGFKTLADIGGGAKIETVYSAA